MVLSGIVSVQAGAGIAARLLHEIPPAAVTGLRLWTSAVAIAVIAGLGRLGVRWLDAELPALLIGRVAGGTDEVAVSGGRPAAGEVSAW